jgi:pimeloyl-ACP methyl ester carboxylesterase
MKHIFYTHGLGGNLSAQPEIEEVFAPLEYTVIRVEVPYHSSVAELAIKLATMTFGELCLLIHDTANTIIERARDFAPQEYAVIGDSLGGFISLVAAQRDPRVSHCILLACSGDICNALLNLDHLLPGMSYWAGMFNLAGNGGLKIQAHKAISGQSDFQQQFELVNTFRPERLARLNRLLILGDKRDPVAPAAACRHFARGVEGSKVVMAYNEGRHHPIGKEALQKYAVPFLQNKPLSTTDRIWATLSSLRKLFTGSSTAVSDPHC